MVQCSGNQHHSCYTHVTSFVYSFTTLEASGRKPSSEDVVQKEDTSVEHWRDATDKHTPEEVVEWNDIYKHSICCQFFGG